MQGFISYSHHDSWALDLLHKHLAMLQREGRITAWYDREILAGDNIDAEIFAQLDRSELFIALVSPDFIDSRYCYEREMMRAMERQEAGLMRIVPVIVEPCEWKVTPLVQFKALPKEGKAVSEWTNRNSAFLDVVTELRRLVIPKAADASQGGEKLTASLTIQRNYRLKKTFDAIDRVDFRRNAFEEMVNYLEASIFEIDSVDGIKARCLRVDSNGLSCSVLNQEFKGAPAYLTLRENAGMHGMGDIYYTHSENAPQGSAHGAFRITSDEYDLFLEQSFGGAAFGSVRSDEKMTARSAAEKLWWDLLKRAGIDYD